MQVQNVLEHYRYRPIFDLAVEGARKGRPPSIADVTRVLGRTASSVHDQVKRLEKEQLIELVGDSPRTRSIVPTPKGFEEAKITAPVTVAAQVPASHEFDAPAHAAACGRPSWADGTIERPTVATLFPGFRDGDLIVYARGYSMVDESDVTNSIMDGDWVWVRPCEIPVGGVEERAYIEFEASSGEHECAVKIFQMDDETGIITLKSTNPAYDDIVINAADVRRYCEVRGFVHYTGAKK